MSAPEAWKYPLKKQSLSIVSALALEIGMEADRKEGRPKAVMAEYLRES